MRQATGAHACQDRPAAMIIVREITVRPEVHAEVTELLEHAAPVEAEARDPLTAITQAKDQANALPNIRVQSHLIVEIYNFLGKIRGVERLRWSIPTLTSKSFILKALRLFSALNNPTVLQDARVENRPSPIDASITSAPPIQVSWKPTLFSMSIRACPRTFNLTSSWPQLE